MFRCRWFSRIWRARVVSTCSLISINKRTSNFYANDDCSQLDNRPCIHFAEILYTTHAELEIKVIVQEDLADIASRNDRRYLNPKNNEFSYLKHAAADSSHAPVQRYASCIPGQISWSIFRRTLEDPGDTPGWILRRAGCKGQQHSPRCRKTFAASDDRESEPDPFYMYLLS